MYMNDSKRQRFPYKIDVFSFSVAVHPKNDEVRALCKFLQMFHHAPFARLLYQRSVEKPVLPQRRMRPQSDMYDSQQPKDDQVEKCSLCGVYRIPTLIFNRKINIKNMTCNTADPMRYLRRFRCFGKGWVREFMNGK